MTDEEEFEENELEAVEETEDPEPLEDWDYGEDPDFIVPVPDPEPPPPENAHCCCDCIYIPNPTGLVHFYDQPLSNPTGNPHVTIDGDYVTLVSWVSGSGNESSWGEVIRTAPTSHRQTAWRVTFSISEIVGWLVHPNYSNVETPYRSQVTFAFWPIGATLPTYLYNFMFYRLFVSAGGPFVTETTYRGRFFAGGTPFPFGWQSDAYSFPFEPDDEITIEYNRPRHSETRRLRVLINGEVTYSIPLNYEAVGLKDCQDWGMTMAMRAFGPSVAIGHVTRSRFIQDWYNGWLLQNWIDSDFSDWTLTDWTVPQNGQLRRAGSASPNSIEIPLEDLIPGAHYRLCWQASHQMLSGLIPSANSFWTSTVNGGAATVFQGSGRRWTHYLNFVPSATTATIVLSGSSPSNPTAIMIASGFSLLSN